MIQNFCKSNFFSVPPTSNYRDSTVYLSKKILQNKYKLYTYDKSLITEVEI